MTRHLQLRLLLVLCISFAVCSATSDLRATAIVVQRSNAPNLSRVIAVVRKTRRTPNNWRRHRKPKTKRRGGSNQSEKLQSRGKSKRRTITKKKYGWRPARNTLNRSKRRKSQKKTSRNIKNGWRSRNTLKQRKWSKPQRKSSRKSMSGWRPRTSQGHSNRRQARTRKHRRHRRAAYNRKAEDRQKGVKAYTRNNSRRRPRRGSSDVKSKKTAGLRPRPRKRTGRRTWRKTKRHARARRDIMKVLMQNQRRKNR